ncbi:hypothetical protein [Methanopyrus kandleri]|uniref:Uncharacterized secreted protein specific for M.kandleri, MK-3 family n=1 Tax=Methanopyrus kandleri (strain AV19 / DSM 6324 / JCM 9639 / NBRC 100938) TaxID=190192 RepID=Q8TVP2_METKA|nr:hypothetical protein [Methanopyrus kandleri]AAM02559.1 Uncharacterized secreted protein specific for M.kandleri, MK-3 family [Methanopyrus kandleri AV19]
MLPYLVLGLVLALAPASGELLIRGSLSEDKAFLKEYLESEVLPKWKDDPRVIVDYSDWHHRLVYLPDRDLFVGTDGPATVTVGPGSVRVEVQLATVTEAGRESIQVSKSVRDPAVVANSGFDSVTVLVGDYVCGVEEKLVVGGPPYYIAVLKEGDRVIDREDLGGLSVSDVEYEVYSDRVVMRVLGFGEGGKPLAIIVTFDLKDGRILVDREEITDAALIEKLSGELVEYPEGAVLRTGSGVEPLYVKFGAPRDDPLVRFIDKVVRMYGQGASEEELRRVMSEHSNVEFLFPERGGGEESGLPVWVLPLLPVPLTVRRR